jgi:hypothetical protein
MHTPYGHGLRVHLIADGHSPQLSGRPRINEREPQSSEIPDITCREIKSISSGDPGDLKVGEFVWNLVLRESLRSRLRQEFRRRVGCGNIERVHARAEAPDRSRHGVLKQIFAPSGIKQRKSSTELEDGDARNGRVCKVCVEPVYDLRCGLWLQRLRNDVRIEQDHSNDVDRTGADLSSSSVWSRSTPGLEIATSQSPNGSASSGDSASSRASFSSVSRRSASRLLPRRSARRRNSSFVASSTFLIRISATTTSTHLDITISLNHQRHAPASSGVSH